MEIRHIVKCICAVFLHKRKAGRNYGSTNMHDIYLDSSSVRRSKSLREYYAKLCPETNPKYL